MNGWSLCRHARALTYFRPASGIASEGKCRARAYSFCLRSAPFPSGFFFLRKDGGGEGRPVSGRWIFILFCRMAYLLETTTKTWPGETRSPARRLVFRKLESTSRRIPGEIRNLSGNRHEQDDSGHVTSRKRSVATCTLRCRN